jgi:hypothetical protein
MAAGCQRQEKQSFRLYVFDQHVKDDVFVTRIGDLPLHTLTGCEGHSLERHTEPVAEFLGIR